MSFLLLLLPSNFKEQGWKVKIRDRERLEPPHVTVLYKTRSWRIGLRDGKFLERNPDPREVPVALLEVIKSQLSLLRQEWDEMYPFNPV